MKLDIIILIYNQLNITKVCLQSIQKYTKAKYRLIIVDNGSTDNSEKWIQDFCKQYKISLLYIKNKNNIGVSKGWNQGLKRSSSEYVAILNNDIVVTLDWEINLIHILQNFSTVLLVYPNSMQDDFTIENISYGLHFSYSIESTKVFSGYCFIIKRQCIKEIGYFDERFTPFLCEDTDYAYRLLINKTPPVKVYSSFVYHLKSKTLNTFKYAKIYARNKKKLMNKYSEKVKIDIDNLTFEQFTQKILEKLDNNLVFIFNSIHKFVDIKETKETNRKNRTQDLKLFRIPIFKIISPINFPPSKNIPHGTIQYFKKRPKWSYADSVITEKIVLSEKELEFITFNDEKEK